MKKTPIYTIATICAVLGFAVIYFLPDTPGWKTIKAIIAPNLFFIIGSAYLYFHIRNTLK